MREQSPQPERDLDGYTKNGFYGRVQEQILKLEAEGRKARAESFIVIPKQGIWRRMGRRTFYRLFGLHYVTEEDDPITKGIQAAINRAHSRIFIKDGIYYLNKAVQYPTNNPNSPSVLWYDFPKAIILEGESPDAVLQLDNGVFLFKPDDSYVNTPFLRLQTLTVEGLTGAEVYNVGGAKGGYFFFWDVTMKNINQGVFATNLASLRHYRVINTLTNVDTGGVNFAQSTVEIDGYYVLGFSDNALAFNGGNQQINANNIFIFTGNGITPNEYAIVFATPPGTTTTYNANLDNIVTDWGVAISYSPNISGTCENIYIGRMQVAGRSVDNAGLVLGTVNNLHISQLIMNNGYISANSGNVTNCTIDKCDVTWSNPNLGLNVVSPVSSTQTGTVRIGKLTMNVQVAVPAAPTLASFNGTPYVFTVDVDEIDATLVSGATLSFAPPSTSSTSGLVAGLSVGSRVGRVKINGAPQLFPLNFIPNPPISGLILQNTNGYGIVLLIPVALTPTSSAAASASISVGSSPSTLSTVQTLSQAAGAGPVGGVLQAAVPSGQYYQITLTNATAYQAIVLPE